jgi:squalene-hopene/tetraprenyl-beta-curcumene cyclase
MKTISARGRIVAACVGMSVSAICAPPEASVGDTWNPKKAADYLDKRISWWMAWTAAARGQGTFCISCHTAVPYALARPALRGRLGEVARSTNERRLLDSVTKRVRLWNDVEPFYKDHGNGDKTTARSRGTEAVLNALILASDDARSDRLTDETRIAFSNMWSLQRNIGNLSGSWWWLQFGNEPFEAHDSDYYGAALAAVAVGTAPENYRSTPEVQNNLKLLREYLHREYATQSPINHIVLLWASTKWPGLVASEQQRSIMSDIVAMQQADGGWNLASLTWTWRDWRFRSLVNMFIRSYGTPLKGKSDAYATGVIAFALEQAGVRSDNVTLKRAVDWLVRNQNQTEGFWQAYSLNNRRDPTSAAERFMSDAATAYAVLALAAGN